MLRKLLFTLAAVGAIAAVSAPQALAQNPPHVSWQTNGTVRAVAIANGVVYLGGQFTSLRPAGAAPGSPLAVTRHNAAAFNATTGKPTAWNPNVTGRVDALRVVGSRVYLGGLFTAVRGVARSNAAAVGANAGKITPWRAGTNGSVRALALAPGGNILMGGDFTRVAGLGRSHLAAGHRELQGDRLAPQGRADLRLCVSPALPCRRVHDPDVAQRQERLLRRPLRTGQRRLAKRGRRGLAGRATHARVQPQHL